MKSKIVIVPAIILVLCTVRYKAGAQTPGFVQTDVVKVAGITNDSLLYSLAISQRQTTKAYYDGLGRPLQQIAVQASPAYNDLIQPVAYDNLGRQTTSYLPYAGKAADTIGQYRRNAISTDQAAFYYQTTQYLIDTDKAPYSQRVFENSPLQRVLEEGMTGSGFQPGGSGTQYYKTAAYRPNNSTENNILVWNPDGTYTTGSYYAVNSLTVTDARDEDNTETLIFKNYLGQVILKRQKLGSTNLDTYYIYNNAGMISYVVPPLATSVLGVHGYSLGTTPLSNLVFKYVYDSRGRVVEKTTPSRGTIYIVYDPLSRPVLMQDANMLAKNQWNYIKYDARGRVICQGVYTDGITTPVSHIGRVSMQSYVNGLSSSYNTTWYEKRTATLTNNGYYTSAVFPTAITGTTLTALAYAYFDDYNMKDDGLTFFSYAVQHDVSLPGEGTPTGANVKGMPTAVSQTTVGAGLSNTWLTKVTFYDKNLRAIQVQSNNQLNYTNATTLTDTKTVANDFTGAPLASKVTKKRTATDTTTVYTKLSYDQVYRLTEVRQKYNTGIWYSIAVYTYNEIGQLVKKSLDSVSGSWLQNVDMRYNIRGQVLSINNSKLTSDTGKTNSDANDVFGMRLFYDKVDSKLGNTAYHNGKLSAVEWMSLDGSGTKSYERAFKYYYDALNRDTAAIYAERPTTYMLGFTTTNGWNENRISYDLNGNLLTLFRDSTSQASGGHTPIDNLSYSYSTPNPNQVTSIADATGNHSGFVGGSGAYTYDSNGNLTNEPYKGIIKMSYNVLNRMDTLKLSSTQYITYTYDAGGNMIRKQAYKSGVTTLVTDYIDGFVYNNAGGTEILSYFPMPEGRVLYNGSTYTQEFIITDPQGNARVSFQNNSGAAKVYQENSYYPFGLIMPGTTVAMPTTPNKQLYNGGSEWQNDYSNLPNYYQTFNRNYDAATGRFIGADPVAESAESMSSYQYAGNNPIMNNDPLGDKFDPNPPPSYGGGFGLMMGVGELFWQAVDLNMELGITTFGMGSYLPSGGLVNGVAVYVMPDGSIETMSGSDNNYVVIPHPTNPNGTGNTWDFYPITGGIAGISAINGFGLGNGWEKVTFNKLANMVHGITALVGYTNPNESNNILGYNFIQTVSENGGPEKLDNRGDLLTDFYYHDTESDILRYEAQKEIAENAGYNDTVYLHDTPLNQVDAVYTATFTTTVVAFFVDGSAQALSSIQWKYSINANGVSYVSPSNVPIPQSHQDIVNDYNNFGESDTIFFKY